MLENQTEHTFIVTVDKNSVLAARQNPLHFAVLKGVLFLNGITKDDAKKLSNDGLYYSKKMKA